MSTKAEQIQATTSNLVDQCKAANTVAEVIGLGRRHVHGGALDGVLHQLSINPDISTAIDTLRAFSDMLATWVSELRTKASQIPNDKTAN